MPGRPSAKTSALRIGGLSTRADDPIVLLRNKHTVLLGRLQALEGSEPVPRFPVSMLRALIRDSAVHFKREALLLEVLGPKLGETSRAINRLLAEHRALSRRARQLMKEREQLRTNSNREKQLRLESALEDFAMRFRAHIQHEETVTHVLAQTRLNATERKKIAVRMLTA